MEKELQGPHELRLDGRKKLTVTGVREVESFDEETAVMETAQGTLVIRGRDLHLQNLSIDGGCVQVDGLVEGLSYEEARKQGGSFFSRLFR